MASIKSLSEEIKKYIEKNEKILQIVFGRYTGKTFGKEVIREGIFVATNNRVIFYGKKFGGYDMEVFPYSTISSIEISKGFFTAYTITIYASGNKVMMKYITHGDAEKFVVEVREKIGKKDSAPNDDVYIQLEKLALLKQKKIITANEYEQKKTELLKRI